MSTLDLLKAYHMRFETESERIAKIRELWSRFNEEPNDEPEKDTSTARENARRAARRQQIDYNVLALLLISHSVVPWDYEIKKISHVDKLKGILGTHTRDRVIDEKLEASVGMSRVKDESVKQIGKGIPTPIFDLLDPIHPGLPFFQALDQYLRMSEAIALVLNLSYEALREPDFNQFLHINRDTDLNYDQRLILSIALVAWADRFLPRGALTKSPLEMANTLSQDMEFRAYAHAFARFLDRMRARNYGKEYVGVYSRLSKAALIRVLNFHSIDQNLLLLPHHSTSPAACRRTFMTRTHPDNILTWEAGYRKAFIAESERARNDIKSKK